MSDGGGGGATSEAARRYWEAMQPREWGALHALLGGEVEARGWADDSPLENADEMRHAWWRGRAVAFDDAFDDARAQPRALLRYRGYEDEAEDEWRPLSQLRPFEAEPSQGWRAAPRAVGEAVEVSWAPDGHPSARWAARVVGVKTPKRGLPRVNVRYDGFGDDWDEWLRRDDARLSPARPPFCVVTACFSAEGSAILAQLQKGAQLAQGGLFIS